MHFTFCLVNTIIYRLCLGHGKFLKVMEKALESPGI